MASTKDSPAAQRDRSRLTSRQLLIVTIGASALLVTVIGGYRFGWTWAGFADNGTLWDWLHLLVVPAVLTVLALRCRTRNALRIRWRSGAGDHDRRDDAAGTGST